MSVRSLSYPKLGETGLINIEGLTTPSNVNHTQGNLVGTTKEDSTKGEEGPSREG